MTAHSKKSISLESIRYRRGKNPNRSLEILNQLLLPFESVYEQVKDTEDGFNVIRTMKVRGAPAIAIVAALSLAVELFTKCFHQKVPIFHSATEAKTFILEKLEYLKGSRPTAVNLFDAADKLSQLVCQKESQILANESCQKKNNDVEVNTTGGHYWKPIVEAYLFAAENMLKNDIDNNKAIGRFGSDFISQHYNQRQEQSSDKSGFSVLTHCNTGSLATAGWGTALGIVRQLHQDHQLNHVYCTETRPYNQGSRLTAYELVYEHMPSTLICDNMVSALLKEKLVDAIVVGADRVAANGDTANKIGTYQLAIAAQYHNIPFIVAAPTTSIDLTMDSGDKIPIETRPSVELTQIRGLTVEDEAGVKEPKMGNTSPFNLTGGTNITTTRIEIAARGIEVWNPAFDVTPASLITAIVTEQGTFLKSPEMTNSFELKTKIQK